jgi:predicted ATP-grasp superfamily ATP-dependent carboligase
MAVPVIVLSFFHHLAMKSTCEALAYGGQVEIHAVTGIQIDRRYGTEFLSSVTVLPPNPCNDEQIINIILSIARRIGSAALVPVWTDDVAFVARNYEALRDANPIPVPDNKLLEKLVNKLYFMRLAESLGFSTPVTMKMVSTLDVQDTIDRLWLPMLAKPVIGEGGVGIIEISNAKTLKKLLESSAVGVEMILQQKVPGEDVALTLLADKGKIFSVMLRKRWFTRWQSRAFDPMADIEFFRDDWLEGLCREFVHQTQFSGIADFDLKVDFESHRVWFLESDPRMMGGLISALLFGLNIPWLLVEQTRGHLLADFCAQPEMGHFLSLRSIPDWIVRAAWRQPRRGPLRTNLRSYRRNLISHLKYLTKSSSKDENRLSSMSSRILRT